MKIWFAAAALALAAWSGVSRAPAFAQATAGLARDRTDQASDGGQEQSAPAAGAAATVDRLSDLDAMTFSCPKAGLNAAAREAAKVPSQGTYQFAYFKIISDGHHAAYEIHFKSNYEGEADLKYCVSVYCQQGWDPKTKTSVTLMKNSCGHQPARVNPRSKR